MRSFLQVALTALITATVVCGLFFIWQMSSLPDSSEAQTVKTLETPLTKDQLFIKNLDDHGIPYTTEEKAIAVAHTICDLLDREPEFYVIAGMNQKYAHLTEAQNFSLFLAAQQFYCPASFTGTTR